MLLPKQVLVVLLVLSVLDNARSGDILAILSSPLRSHQNFFHAVINTLATQHNITLYGPPVKTANANVTYRDLQHDTSAKAMSKTLFKGRCEITPSYEVVQRLGLPLSEEYFETMLRGKDFQHLINSNDNYELIITTTFTNEHFLLLSEKFNAPIILISPSITMPWNNLQIGNPNFFTTDLNMVSQDLPDNFINRFMKFYRHMYILYFYNYKFMPLVNRVTQKYFPPGSPSLEEMNKNIALIFENTNSGIGNARANLPNVVQIGGLHCKESKPLPADLEEFIATAPHGVVYVSLGGTILGKDLPAGMRSLLLGAFSKIPQRVLWKWEGEISNLPKNIRVSRWFPQNDILGHENVRLFVTQGGMLSYQEALYHGVPVLVIPLICDQYINAYLAERHHYGQKLSLCDITQQKLVEKIMELISNNIYKYNAKEVSDYLRKRNNTPTDRLLRWTDYVMHHKNSPLLHAESRNFSIIQQYQIDIYLALMIILFLIIYSFIYVTNIIYALLRFTYELLQNNILDDTAKKIK